MKVFRFGHLTVVARRLILAEDWRAGVNDDRIPQGGMRLKVSPGEDLIIDREDAEDFRRQLDEMFPRRPKAGEGRPTVAGRPHDPETGRPLPTPNKAVEGG